MDFILIMKNGFHSLEKGDIPSIDHHADIGLERGAGVIEHIGRKFLSPFFRHHREKILDSALLGKGEPECGPLQNLPEPENRVDFDGDQFPPLL